MEPAILPELGGDGADREDHEGQHVGQHRDDRRGDAGAEQLHPDADGVREAEEQCDERHADGVGAAEDDGGIGGEAAPPPPCPPKTPRGWWWRGRAPASPQNAPDRSTTLQRMRAGEMPADFAAPSDCPRAVTLRPYSVRRSRKRMTKMSAIVSRTT